MNEMIHKYHKILKPAAIIFVLLVICCSSPYTVSTPRWNLSAIYNPASSHLHPSFRVYHSTDNVSLLHVKLFPDELLFNQANPSGEYMSSVSVEVRAYEILDQKPELADSITYNYAIKQENAGRRFLSQIPLKLELGKRYQLRIVTRDLLRNDLNLRFIEVDKTDQYSEQNFNIVNNKGIPYFNTVMHAGMIYKIQHRKAVGDKLFVYYYKNRAPLPKVTVPSVQYEKIYNEPDSIYEIDYSPNLMLSFSYEGVYNFRFDTNHPGGIMITNFGNNFPKIKESEELIEPLAYITNNADFNKLKQEENMKLASDNFWLGVGETTGRARELIRIFYNRVYFSNYYFSNTVPGWKTDRGMIYIVYGPPKNMEKTPNSETWIYYMKGAGNTIKFTFEYKPQPYNLENFVLNRSDNHEWHWTEAVNSWRRGEIFLMD